MREIIYKYNHLGSYQTEQDTNFAGDAELQLTIEPHNFSITVGDEVLRQTSFDGCRIVVSHNGAATFYDNENRMIGQADKSETSYAAVQMTWQQDVLAVQFGRTETIDYYPNCDGEYDRWGKEWIVERTVTLHEKDHSVEIA